MAHLSSLVVLHLAWCTSAFSGNVAVYWGQASAESQNGLRYYCDIENVSIINLAFLNRFPEGFDYENDNLFRLEIFDKECTTARDSTNDNLERTNCEPLGDSIKYCQSLGKKIMLSLGGESSRKSAYGFRDDNEAAAFAHVLWNSFGGGHSAYRPFGDAVVDGFDFDIENGDSTGYVQLVESLKSLCAASSSGRKYLFTAAPQCTFPDESLQDLITSVELDYVSVQFYNNYCGLESHQFNLDKWSALLEGFSTKILVGLPASRRAAASGFVGSSTIISRLKESVAKYKNVDGVMFWDASLGFSNGHDITSENSFIAKIIDELKANELMTNSAAFSVASSGSTTTTNASPRATGFVQSSNSSTATSSGSLGLRKHLCSALVLLTVLVTVIII